jgi:hypothetical protein
MDPRTLAVFAWMMVAAIAFAGEEEVSPTSPKENPAGAGDDYQPLVGAESATAGPFGNLDKMPRRLATLKKIDEAHRRITLLLEGEETTRAWPLRPDAEIWRWGLWGRLKELSIGDRVWVWFGADRDKNPVDIALLADELSEQDWYAPLRITAVNAAEGRPVAVELQSTKEKKTAVRTVSLAGAELYRGNAQAPLDTLQSGETVYVATTGAEARLILDSSAFDVRRADQMAKLLALWIDEGLPGALIFAHPERRELEVMLHHEAMDWGRSLCIGDHVTLQAPEAIPAVVQRLRPWRERTQLLLRTEGADAAAVSVGQRVHVRLKAPLEANITESAPSGLDQSRGKSERVEWLAASIYCPCLMHDDCAGHFFTLAACNAGCGMAKGIRQQIAEGIDQGQTDRQIYEKLVAERGRNLRRPHMLP